MSVNEWQCDINKLILFCSIHFLLVFFCYGCQNPSMQHVLKVLYLPLFVCANSRAFFFCFQLPTGLSDSVDVSVVIYILLVLNFCASHCRNWEIKWWN